MHFVRSWSVVRLRDAASNDMLNRTCIGFLNGTQTADLVEIYSANDMHRVMHVRMSPRRFGVPDRAPWTFIVAGGWHLIHS